MDDLDAWRAAAEVIKLHGADAAGFAGQRAIDLHVAGDLAGEEAWVRIMMRIYELQRRSRAEGEASH